MSSNKEISISVVIPVLNEKATLRRLYEKVCLVCRKTPSLKTFEILFVNDGSTDGSHEELDQLAKEDPSVAVLHLHRNLGKSVALQTGFKAARGKLILTIDADLQDDPEEIPALIQKLEEGFDLVSGWKRQRQDKITKSFASRIFNRTLNWVAGTALHDCNCGLKLFRSEAAKSLNLQGDQHRYIPFLLHWKGFQISEIPVKHYARVSGKSKYGIDRYGKALMDLFTVVLITRFRYRPLHLFGFLGGMVSLVGFSILAYLSILWGLDVKHIGSRPLFFLGILLMIIGIQFFSTGLLGELINHRLPSSQDRHVKRASGWAEGRPGLTLELKDPPAEQNREYWKASSPQESMV